MDVFQAIKERKSVREYTGEGISDKDLNKLLQSARMAPSAKNLQPWQIIVVTDFETKKELVGVCQGQMFIEDAGAVIIGLVEDTKWSEIDLAISLDHLSLEAVELGLGTCWIGSFNSDKLKEIIQIPSRFEPFVLMTVGYPDDDSHSPTKKAVEELVRWIEPQPEDVNEVEEDITEEEKEAKIKQEESSDQEKSEDKKEEDTDEDISIKDIISEGEDSEEVNKSEYLEKNKVPEESEKNKKEKKDTEVNKKDKENEGSGSLFEDH